MNQFIKNMKNIYSPANVITIAGGALSFIGMVAFFTDSVNLSVPTFFYGVPILLIGLALKTSEVPPVRLINKDDFTSNKFSRPEEITNLVKDVTRWRYGIQAHLQSSLEVLKLWNEDNPPQLKELEEITQDKRNGIKFRFEINSVPIDEWVKKKERLNRFFAKGLESDIIIDDNKKEFYLILFY
tara:strand:- start:10591 stop:11142 length:552 start_codon:yes stop_codon:yes gene_type:complete